MIAHRPKNAVCLHHGCVHPPPALSGVNPSDALQLYLLGDLISWLLRATLLPPGVDNDLERTMISHSRPPQLLFQPFHYGLHSISSFLGFDSSLKIQSSFVTNKLIQLRGFPPEKSDIFSALPIIPCRYNYSIQRLHSCLGLPGFRPLSYLKSLVCRSFRNLEIFAFDKWRLVKRMECITIFKEILCHSSVFTKFGNYLCSSPPGNSSGFTYTRFSTQSGHSNSVYVRHVIHESRIKISLQNHTKHYFSSCKRKCLLFLSRCINPKLRSLCPPLHFLNANNDSLHQRLKPLLPKSPKVPWANHSRMTHNEHGHGYASLVLKILPAGKDQNEFHSNTLKAFYLITSFKSISSETATSQIS
jgi:hypothetical protein